jgi:hypothetical protein
MELLESEFWSLIVIVLPRYPFWLNRTQAFGPQSPNSPGIIDLWKFKSRVNIAKTDFIRVVGQEDVAVRKERESRHEDSPGWQERV